MKKKENRPCSHGREGGKVGGIGDLGCRPGFWEGKEKKKIVWLLSIRLHRGKARPREVKRRGFIAATHLVGGRGEGGGEKAFLFPFAGRDKLQQKRRKKCGVPGGGKKKRRPVLALRRATEDGEA